MALECRVEVLCTQVGRGQALAVSGASDVLGAWDYQYSFKLSRETPETALWFGTVPCPRVGSEFKFLIVTNDGHLVGWEPIRGGRSWPAGAAVEGSRLRATFGKGGVRVQEPAPADGGFLATLLSGQLFGFCCTNKEEDQDEIDLSGEPGGGTDLDFDPTQRFTSAGQRPAPCTPVVPLNPPADWPGAAGASGPTRSSPARSSAPSRERADAPTGSGSIHGGPNAQRPPPPPEPPKSSAHSPIEPKLLGSASSESHRAAGPESAPAAPRPPPKKAPATSQDDGRGPTEEVPRQQLFPRDLPATTTTTTISSVAAASAAEEPREPPPCAPSEPPAAHEPLKAPFVRHVPFERSLYPCGQLDSQDAPRTAGAPAPDAPEAVQQLLPREGMPLRLGLLEATLASASPPPQAACPQDRPWFLLPSVGTWLRPVPLRVGTAGAPASASWDRGRGATEWFLLPSVGTWLIHRQPHFAYEGTPGALRSGLAKKLELLDDTFEPWRADIDAASPTKP